MQPFDSTNTAHRRYNPLTGEWVLVSPHRTNRPWQGKKESSQSEQKLTHDPQCYLCPGTERAGGLINPLYTDTYVFPNDFAALLPESRSVEPIQNPLLKTEAVRGECRVLCFSPRHDLTLPEMTIEAIQTVVETWKQQVAELEKQYKWVQVFENKGELMGCSNPHPHGQIWASDFLPNEPMKEEKQQREYYDKEQSPLLLDYAQIEQDQQERIVVENEHWLVVVPYWAIWPFETLLLPKRAIQTLPDITPEEGISLAKILKNFLTLYDNLFEVSFPYSMGWHQAPNQATSSSKDNQHWQLHAHFYPPLLRSATVKKFMVGYEMLSEAQRDLTAEQAVAKLRTLSQIHYKNQQGRS